MINVAKYNRIEDRLRTLGIGVMIGSPPEIGTVTGHFH
jgi:hypothetical protein